MISSQSVSSREPSGPRQHALHVDLGARLGEREERGPEAHLRAGPPVPAGELGERGLEVHERDPLVDHQPLDLHERGRVRGVVRVPPVDPARRDDADRGLVRLHRAHLHGRRVAPQQHRVDEVERVLLVRGRMVERRVERLEVVPLGVGLGAAGAREAEVAEDAPDLVDRLRDRMEPAPATAPREGSVRSSAKPPRGARAPGCAARSRRPRRPSPGSPPAPRRAARRASSAPSPRRIAEMRPSLRPR